ncbi:MAG: alpha/beta hydrolase-fold protein [Mangrovibacterium sp.]
MKRTIPFLLNLIGLYFLFFNQPTVAFSLTDSLIHNEDVIPKGRIEQFQFNESKIYPGTTRTVTVYIPARIDPSVPACVYVSQDGHSPGNTDVMDLLIARKEMPVTVGVFISRGQMPYPTAPQDIRNNRPYEYNSLGDGYARFILEEILPLVSRKYNLNLSEDGNDRCIGGGSSGGICAFNAAWERPDEFRRVYSSCGSFVAYNGGNVFPVLIRKCEPKPIRVYLHGAKNDLNNAGGNFWLTYKEMEDALAFSGYDYKSVETSDGHCQSYDSLFPDAMRWLWRDYPGPVKEGVGPARIKIILSPEEKWVELKDGFNQVDELTADKNGEVFFCDGKDNRIYKIDTTGLVSLFSADARHISGLTIARDGSVYGLSEKTGKISAFDLDGKSRLIAKRIPGSGIKAICDGSFYTLGKEGGKGKIWHVSRAGKIRIVDSGLQAPVACDILYDKILFVADSCSQWISSYMIGADDSLLYKQHTIWVDVLPDPADDNGVRSVCADPDGNIFVSTRAGIWVGSDQPYENQGIISSPSSGKISSFCLAGNNIYATDGNKIFRRKLKVGGD